jgi:hypothetical protein
MHTLNNAIYSSVLLFHTGSPSKEALDEAATCVPQNLETQEKVGHGTLFHEGRV